MVNVSLTTQDAYNLMHNGILAFQRAEKAGIRIDTNYCERKQNHLTRKEDRLLRLFKTTELAHKWKRKYKEKTNYNSDYQLGDMLYNVLQAEPPKRTSSGKGSVDEEALRQLDVDGLQRLLDLRKIRKTRDTYLENFKREQVGGYIHPIINLHTTQTFRPSTNNPNLANIPKRDAWMHKACRQALFPRPGHQLFEVDFGALEVMIAYCYHKDPNMYEYLTSDEADMHGDMAKQIFILDGYFERIQNAGGLKKVATLKTLRDATKNGFVFPQFYGDYHGNNAISLACEWGKLPKGKWKKGQGIPMPDCYLSDHFIRNGIKSFDDFVEHMKKIEEDFWNRRFAEYGNWRENWLEKYRENGYFDMFTGFRCKGVMRKNEVINYPVQGAAFHCLLWCFIEVDRIAQEEGWDSRLVNQIYDSMILDVHPDELEHVAWTINKVATVDLPNAWPWIQIPLEVEADACPVDHSWAMKESYELPKVA